MPLDKKKRDTVQLNCSIGLSSSTLGLLALPLFALAQSLHEQPKK